MRDHEEGMDEDFWRNAEKLVGVGYDGAVLGVEEDADPDDEGERFTAWIAPPEIHDTHRKWKFELRDKGATRRDAIEKLARRVYRELKKHAYAQLRNALPYAEWRRMAEEAELLLSVEHTVVLGSKGDDEEAIAMSLLRRDYWQDVRRRAQDLIGQIKNGEITSSDEFEDRLREIEIIYTSDAHKTLWFSNNDDAYKEEMGEPAETIEAAAAFALQTDVREEVGRRVEVQHLREIDCPRCGTVVVWTDPDEDEECRKCGYPTSVEVSRAHQHLDGVLQVGGVVTPDPTLCETCLEDVPESDAGGYQPTPHRDDFTCDLCGADFTQPKADPPASAEEAPTPPETPDGDAQP